MTSTTIILLLLSFGGFGVDANPNALSHKEVLRLSPKTADYMMHVDLVGLVPKNYEVFKKLPQHPKIKNETEALRMVTELLAQAQQAESMFRSIIGMDIVKDIHSITAWAEIRDMESPNYLAVVRGDFPPGLLSKAGMAGSLETVGEGEAIRFGETLLGMNPANELLVGTEAWIKPRLSKTFRRRGSSALSEGAAMMLVNKPAILFASAPNAKTIKMLESEIKDTDLARMFLDLATGHKFLGVSMLHNGIAWNIQTNSKRGHQRALQASHGTLASLRASHHGTHGLTQLILSVLPSYKKGESVIGVVEALIARNTDIVDLVMSMTGDGTFDATVKDEPDKRTVQVVATGKKLNDVFPVGLLVPLGAVTTFFLHSESEKPATPAKP